MLFRPYQSPDLPLPESPNGHRETLVLGGPTDGAYAAVNSVQNSVLMATMSKALPELEARSVRAVVLCEFSFDRQYGLRL